jgi:hypothetical protein
MQNDRSEQFKNELQNMGFKNVNVVNLKIYPAPAPAPAAAPAAAPVRSKWLRKFKNWLCISSSN